jgi:hypothetical protein
MRSCAEEIQRDGACYLILSLYFTIAVLAIINFPPRPARVAGI